MLGASSLPDSSPQLNNCLTTPATKQQLPKHCSLAFAGLFFPPLKPLTFDARHASHLTFLQLPFSPFLISRMCVGHQGNQDRAASCHTLRQLCVYIQAPLTLLKAPPQELVDTLMRIK